MKLLELDGSYSNEVVELVQLLNPKIQKKVLLQRYQAMLRYPTYRCFGILDEQKELIAVSSAWITTRFYSGKQLELDAVVIRPDQRSKGIGREFEALISEWAIANQCLTMELNSYVANNRSHKFYFNQGYKILGFHFLKKTDGTEF